MYVCIHTHLYILCDTQHTTCTRDTLVCHVISTSDHVTYRIDLCITETRGISLQRTTKMQNNYPDVRTGCYD